MDCELVDCDQVSCKPLLGTCEPWYVSRFSGVDAVALYWQHNYRALRDAAVRFSRALYDTTLLPEVVEAVASNLVDPEVSHDSSTERRPLVGRGRHPRNRWFLLWFLNACVELCPGHSTSFPRSRANFT
jgi:hypothetical protein